MTTYLLDTSAVSLLMKEQPQAPQWLAGLSPMDRVLICVITRGEVLYGLERLPPGQRRRTLEAKANLLFAAIPCQPLVEKVADEYAHIKRKTEFRGTRLDENDLWIAATARALDATLVTADSDFQRVRDLPMVTWSV